MGPHATLKSPMGTFAHLHVHSHYSLLDGLPKIPDLVAAAVHRGFDSMAITDHGALYGAVEFYQECASQNIAPIIGVEAYVAPRLLTDKQPRIDDQAAHLVLLARDLEGYNNLLKLVTIAHLHGFYYKPRIDHVTLERHAQGLVALSGCLKGELAQAILRGDNSAVRETIAWHRRTFGDGNYFLEVQAHPELEDQTRVNEAVRRLGNEYGLPLIATNDSHYLEPEDAEAQDILVCIQTGKKVTDQGRLDMRGVDTSLKTEADMRRDLPGFEDAIVNAGELAKSFTMKLPLGKRFFPAFATPEGETPEAYLRLLTEQGLVKHYTNGVPDEVRERVEYELDIIMKKGYASYFLVVADFVNWARSNRIIATTRGSAAGSLVSFLIGITTVNPLLYNLPFERFLNPHRPSPPDIDMDFADNRRDDVIAYVTAKYGTDQVAQIVTFGTMAARAAVRDVGRALGYPYGLCDRVAKLIPFGSQGFHMTIERALKESPELKELDDSDPQVNNLLNLARKVEGCARHASVHAAGVVIAPSPLTDYLPLQWDVDGKHVITQYDMWSCEDVGLVKMDFLGIRNLSIMGSAVQILKKTKGIEVDLENIPLNDKKTYELMARGETMGMFQLGGSGMTRHLKELKPSTITDVMAMVALFRPGPMDSIPDFIKRKHNPKLITYLDPRLKDILHASYGIITYQDDVLLIAIHIAGYTWEEADKLRKAMGKKIPAEMARQKEKFISGCITHGGITEAKAKKLWELIEPFAAYGFNKAHAASYGIVAYQTAYLKANYPTEFMAALMTAESADLTTVAQAVSECGRLGIAVLPPDINESLSTFTVADDTRIRFGLSAIKNFGEQVAEAVIAERKNRGHFRSLEDFLARTAGRELTKKSLECLIKSGALDSFGHERQQLLDAMDTLLGYARSAAQARAAQQGSLFGAASTELRLKLPPPTPTEDSTKLAWERELLGLYITAHPFATYAEVLNGTLLPLGELQGLSGEPAVTIGGLISATKQVTTKKGEQMLFATIEDTTSSTEVICFPSSYREFARLLQPDSVVAVRGRLSRRDGERKVILQSIQVLTNPSTAVSDIKRWLNGTSLFERRTGTELIITLPAGTAPAAVQELKDLLNAHAGTAPVNFEMLENGAIRRVATPFRVNPSPELLSACQELLGHGSVRTST